MKKKILAFLYCLATACNNKEPQKTGLEGKNLPDFTVLLPDSVTYFNSKHISNKTPFVLIDFGPNCPYSRAQIEEIIKYSNKAPKIKFYLLTTWPFEEMKAFNNKYKLNKYANIQICFDFTNFYESYFLTHGVPSTAIYGKDKRLKNVFVGPVKYSQIESLSFN